MQENIIIVLKKGVKQGDVSISTSTDDTFSDINISNYPFRKIVKDCDRELFIHIPTSPDDILELSESFSHSLSDIKLNISTGPVVDFRWFLYGSQTFLLKRRKAPDSCKHC